MASTLRSTGLSGFRYGVWTGDPSDDHGRSGGRELPRGKFRCRAGRRNFEGRVVRFADAQLQKCYDQNFGEATDSFEPLRQVHALMGAHDWFQMLEGQHSSRVHEVIDHLLLPELRVGLRGWYRRPGAETDSATIEFRTQLNRMTGEQLEKPAEVSRNLSA